MAHSRVLRTFCDVARRSELPRTERAAVGRHCPSEGRIRRRRHEETISVRCCHLGAVERPCIGADSDPGKRHRQRQARTSVARRSAGHRENRRRAAPSCAPQASHPRARRLSTRALVTLPSPPTADVSLARPLACARSCARLRRTAPIVVALRVSPPRSASTLRRKASMRLITFASIAS
jgi:hypothetical protein